MKKGFTLTEMIAVITIIGIILLITIPVASNMIQDNKEDEYKTFVEIVEKALMTYADMDGSSTSISINTLKSNGYINTTTMSDGATVYNKSIPIRKESGKVVINDNNTLELKFNQSGNKCYCCTTTECNSCAC